MKKSVRVLIVDDSALARKLLTDVLETDPDFKKNRNFKRDMFNVVIGILWQLSLVALPVYLVVQKMSYIPIILGILIIGSWILKKNWYDKLEEY